MNTFQDFIDNELPNQNIRSFPKTVPGRVLHIDGDFWLYRVSAGVEPEFAVQYEEDAKTYIHDSFAEIFYKLEKMAGAADYTVHITSKDSSKSNRFNQSVQRLYQGNREQSNLMCLDMARTVLQDSFKVELHADQEADDGLCQAVYQAHNKNLVVIESSDKDLRMVPGLLLDFRTGVLDCPSSSFGDIWIDDSKISKSIKGRGTKFFWSQVLTGDYSDNILGLPRVPGLFRVAYRPNKKFVRSLEEWVAMGTKAQMNAKELKKYKNLEDYISEERKKDCACGPVITELMLRHCKNDRDCFFLILSLFRALESSGYEFRHWRIGSRVTPEKAMFGDMLCLWLRRYKNSEDLFAWLHGVVDNEKIMNGLLDAQNKTVGD